MFGRTVEDMTVVTWDSLRAAEHFVMRSARLVDRYRFEHLFRNGSVEPVRSALAAYRNIDGGYGNGLDPDLRGHSSQPAATAIALSHLDELGHIPLDLGHDVCRHLSTVTNPDGGLPPIRSSVRHTEAAPRLRQLDDFSSDLALTASITGYLYKHHITHPWRDGATAYCWKHINALHWTEPRQAIGVCTFLQNVPDRERAVAALDRLRPMIRASIGTHPAFETRQRVHTVLDLATGPDHIARPLFTDAEIERNLDFFEKAQREDGGWDAIAPHWGTAATLEHEGMRTIHCMSVLDAYGRVGTLLPRPRSDR